MRDSFVFYRGFYEAIEEIPDERDRYKVYKMICDYAFNGTEPNGNGICNLVFKAVKPQIDKSNRRYEESRKNGNTGGRPPVNINAETIAELRNKGLTMEQIAEVFGVSKRTLYYKLKDKKPSTESEISLKNSVQKSAKTSQNNVQKCEKTSCANCTEIAQGFCTLKKEQNACYMPQNLSNVQMCKNLNVNDNDNVNVKERGDDYYYNSVNIKDNMAGSGCGSPADIISLFTKAKGSVATPAEIEMLLELSANYSVSAVAEAIGISVLNGRPLVGYVKGILKNKAAKSKEDKEFEEWAKQWEAENCANLRN